MSENEYYNEIKNLIIDNEINRKVKEYTINKTDLETKYNIGKMLSEAGKHYGEGIIKKYSIKLTNEFGKGYSERSLKYMRKFYDFQKGQALPAFLTWSHLLELLNINNANKINYYIYITKKNCLSYRQLRERIKSKEYERLSDSVRNKIINDEDLNIKEVIPEPILIKCDNIDKDSITEKVLHKLIVDNISEFMKQLGNGYS